MEDSGEELEMHGDTGVTMFSYLNPLECTGNWRAQNNNLVTWVIWVLPETRSL